VLDNNGDSSASSSSSSLIVSIPLSGDGEREYGGENAISGDCGGGCTRNSKNSGEDLGFDLFLGLVLTGGEILMDADLAGEPLEVVVDDDVDSSEFPPLLFMTWSA